MALPGGITAEMRRLTVGGRDGSTRELVLRTVVDVPDAEDWLRREAGALVMLAGTGVTAPELVGVDAAGAECEYPSLLMTCLPGRTVLADEGVEARVSLLARQLVAIHGVRPVVRPPVFVRQSTAESVVVPEGADAGAWGTAIDVIRQGVPAYEGCFLHGDFHPGNVLFEGARITGVVDWAGPSWGPVDLDAAHCSVNLALLHGAEWGLRFAAAYEGAGGVLSSNWLYWLIRDALAMSEELDAISQPWREAGRGELTARVVGERLDGYVSALVGGRGLGRRR
ncbi:phosphotransferase family protein [Kribbella sp. NPDC056345]|uniref:phosphotransferase family protein n=1 Tax=Kribbella sp. NPDC056345 TaxID=3345789 RepID=UPI0035D594DD